MKAAGIIVGCVALVLGALTGCDRSCTVTIKGVIGTFQQGDSVYATLARNWHTIEEPTVFTLYQEGRFTLTHRVEGSAPTVTIVKNGRKHAELELEDLWRYHPSVIDKVSGRKFPLTINPAGDVSGSIEL
jgi:hypothetical protein